MIRPSTQKGVALITVLLVVAIAVILLSRSLTHSSQLVSYEQALLQGHQVKEVTRFVEQRSIIELSELNRQGNKALKDRMKNLALSNSDFIQGDIAGLPGWRYRVLVYDLQSNININYAAANKDYQKAIESIASSEFNAEKLVDWLDEDSDLGSFGAEDANYLAKNPAYLPANRYALRASEIRLIEGMSATAWHALQPNIVALPAHAKTNINTAKESVLRALAPELDIYSIIASRDLENPETIESDQDMAISDFFSGAPDKSQLFSTESRYYDLEIVLSNNTGQYLSRIRLDIENLENPVIHRVPVLDIEAWLFSEGSI